MVGAIVLWGGGNVLIKHIAIDGLTLAVDRMWLGTVIYMGAHLATGGRLSWRSLRAAAPGGLCFAGDIGFFFTALHHTTVADATVIGALQPALAMMIAGPLFGERITRGEVALSCVGIGGVAIAVLGSSTSAGRTAFGDLLA